MPPRCPRTPLVDLDRLSAELDGDATQFIRISGPPRPTHPPVMPDLPSAEPPRSSVAACPTPAQCGPVAVPSSPFRVQLAAAPPMARPGALPSVLVACCAMLTLACVAITGAVLAHDRADPGWVDGRVEPGSDGEGEAWAVDTGDWEADLEEESDSHPESPVASGVSRPAVAAGRPQVAPSAATADLRVELADPQGTTRVAVSCPSGFEGRSGYNVRPMVVPDVPTREGCTLHFRGASPYRFHGVRGGQVLACDFRSGVVTCTAR